MASATYRLRVDLDRDGPARRRPRAVAHGNEERRRTARHSRARFGPAWPSTHMRDDRRRPGRASGNRATRLKTNRSSSPPDSLVGPVDVDPRRHPQRSGSRPETDGTRCSAGGGGSPPSAGRGRGCARDRRAPRPASGLRSETSATDSRSGMAVQTCPCASGGGAPAPEAAMSGPARAFAAAAAIDQPASSVDLGAPLDPLRAERRVLGHADRGLGDPDRRNLAARSRLHCGQALLEEKDEDRRRKQKGQERWRAGASPPGSRAGRSGARVSRTGSGFTGEIVAGTRVEGRELRVVGRGLERPDRQTYSRPSTLDSRLSYSYRSASIGSSRAAFRAG